MKATPIRSIMLITVLCLITLLVTFAFLHSAVAAPSEPLGSDRSLSPARPTAPAAVVELLTNGDFSSGFNPWWVNNVTQNVAGGILTATVPSGTVNPWDAQVGQNGVLLQNGGHYTLTIVAWASTEITVPVLLQMNGAPYTGYFGGSLHLTTTSQTFTMTFTSANDDPAAGFQFALGGLGAFELYVDSVSLLGPEAPPPPPPSTVGELLVNSGFDTSMAPWWKTDSLSATVNSGVLKTVVINPGVNPWDVLLGQHNVPLYNDGYYTLTVVAWADQDVTLTAQLQQDGGSYTGYFAGNVPLTTSPLTYTFNFTSSYGDPAAGFQFQMGARGVYTAYFDKVSLLGPKPASTVVIIPPVRTNQVGYLTHAPKFATISTTETSPLLWELHDLTGTVVASGTTTAFGFNSASSETVQLADFSAYTTPGVSYTLVVSGDQSHPFDIGDNVYHKLQYDALHYFYETRSGIAITLPYVSDPQWARLAGHLDVAPNQGDTNVPCFDQKDINNVQYLGCNYTLTVTKGWYDAGDHGKYVVNGGIAVWTLLNEYERAKYKGGPAALAALADGSVNIPEQSNGVPDILDEARWELEFMLSMQVPLSGTVEGEDLSGMVHHKVHDVAWTGIPMAPANDPQKRYLYPPSTAATLNLAATAAQCARIWQSIDLTFANRCLTAAQKAWDAAVAHPTKYARNNFTGGGPYDDSHVSDEFYWAATELYITTGNSKYLTPTVTSEYYKKVPGTPISGTGVITGSSMTWDSTSALGTLSLAVVPNQLPAQDVNEARANVVKVAQGYEEALKREGYRLPYTPDIKGYPWGSNSSVLNNMLILGLAYDFTHDAQYFDAVSLGMDYLLGRNPNDKSYVSGYGENPLQNPHHRFWAHQADASFPPPPPGVIAGGPDNALEDPYIQGIHPNGCPSYQTCYADNYQSYSTNEEAINWNAPFAWTAAFLNTASTVYGVALTPATDAQAANPGQTITYTLHLTNTGTTTDTFDLTATGNVWNVQLPVTQTMLAAGATATAFIQVTVPANALGGDMDEVVVTATSQSDPFQSASSILTTTANPIYGLALTPAAAAQAANPGQTITYTLRLTNTGNTTDTFHVTATGNVWNVQLPVTQTMLAAGAAANVVVRVTIAANAQSGDSDHATVTATSQGNVSKTASSMLTTTANVVYGVMLVPSTAAQTQYVGRAVTYTLRLTNTTNTTATFAISSTGNLWPVGLSASSVQLAAGVGASLNVTVTIPLTATNAATDTVTIRATLLADPTKTVSAVLTTTAKRYLVSLPIVLK